MNSLHKSQQKSLNVSSRRPLVTILGATATGKSRLALDLAHRHDGEIICADSRTIYRGMDIGTAKPSSHDQRLVRHHLLDVCEPNQRFSAQEFVWQVRAVLEDIWSREKPAFLVGGSGMYIDAVLFGYEFRQPRYPTDKSLNERNLEELVAEARQQYPQEIGSIDVKNRRRVEQLLLMGPAKDDDRQALSLPGLVFGLDRPDDDLKATIASRTGEMLADGWLNEIRPLLHQYGPAAPGLNTVGYKQAIQGLAEGRSEEQIADDVNRATWRMVRKQRTWFRRNKFIEWLTDEQIVSRVDQYLLPETGTIEA